MQDKYISISQLTRYIKFKFDHDEHLGHVFLRGEISNFKAHTRGHYYFTLKDETSRINAVMFSSNASKLLFRPTDGMKVLVTGRVSVYEATGGYQIYIEDMVEDGVGNLYVQFEELKKKLQQEGLFDPSKKKKIPKIPKTVGIITAPTGAAIRDILSTIKRRWPITKTILFPSLVQGASAAPEIIKQIEKAQEFDLDVLIVGRGGGSIEDMWCFNDEQVARAIYACKIPVISAVGHEIDFTISDFVADLRAPTPTGAAEMAVPNISDFYQYFGQIELRLEQAIMTMITSKKDQLETLKKSYILTNPIAMYQVKEQRFDSLFEKIHLLMNSIIANEKNNCQILKQKLENNIQKVLENEQHRYLHALNKLEILNPLLTIKRGYSITRNQDHVVTSIQQVKPHDKIEIEVTDGLIEARVEEVKS